MCTAFAHLHGPALLADPQGCDRFCTRGRRFRRASEVVGAGAVSVSLVRPCTDHSSCSASQFCAKTKTCQACDVCAKAGAASSSIDGYCGCLGGTITVKQPPYRAVWNTGTVVKVGWTSQNVGGSVSVNLYDGDGKHALEASDYVAVDATGAGSFSFALPLALTPGHYYVTIASTRTPSISARGPVTGFVTVKQGGSCESHDACSQSDYCDTYGDCYQCAGCAHYDDAFDGTCPDKCDTAPAKVTFSSPSFSSVFATGSYMPLRWTYNRAVEDEIDLILLERGSLSGLMTIAEGQKTADKGLAWRIPRRLPAGYYWIACVHTGSNRVVGVAPLPAGSFGDTGFRVYSSQCTSHSSCGASEYCDSAGDCFDCSACLHERDAFDGSCPVKCGGGTTFAPGQRYPDVEEEEASGPVVAYAVPGCGSYADLLVKPPLVTPRLAFAGATSTSEPSRMTLRMSQKLDTLAALVAKEPKLAGATILVVTGYQSPPAHPSEATLHHEGRAVEVVLQGADTALLAPLAVVAGFDWVWLRPDSSSVHLSVVRDACRQRLDLVFVLDGSGSVEMPLYGGEPGTFKDRVLPFVRQVVQYFPIGPNHTQVGIMTFSNRMQVNINLKDHSDKALLLDDINIANVPYPKGGTWTAEALDVVRTNMFTEANGVRPLSAGASRVVIIVTDGNANNGHYPKAAAEKLRVESNANVFAVGVGSSIGIEELNDMASDPDHQHVVTLKSFTRITDLVDTMSATTCEQGAVVTPGTQIGPSAVAACESEYFQPICGYLTNVRVEVRTVSGAVDLYVSRSERNPGPLNFDLRDVSGDELKVIHIRREAGDTRPVYVGVHGVGSAPSDYILDVWSDLFGEREGAEVQQLREGEATAVGTEVFRVPPVALNGLPVDPQFQFAIVDGNTGNDFEVDSATGRVTLARALDHERTRSYSLRISARAKNIPCLTGLATVNVAVVDTNDNAPEFPHATIRVSIPETTAVGSLVVTASATDPDLEAGGRLTYSVVGGGVSAFDVDPGTGAITTALALDHEGQDVYTFEVAAADAGQPPLVGTVSVVITVTKVACAAGTFSVPTGTAPCRACPSGTFQDGRQPGKPCAPCGGCPADSYASGACTAERNFDCTACPAGSSSPMDSRGLSDCACDPGHYNAAPAPGLVCQRCLTSCSRGFYLDGECTDTSGPVCRPCRTSASCQEGAFLQGACSAASNPTCTPCTDCEAGQYVTQACSADGDRRCAACPDSCPVGEYMSHQCEGANTPAKPTCVACTRDCAVGQFLAGECGKGPGGTGDARCAACTVCATGEYQTRACGEGKDRLCAKCPTTCPSGQYVVGACRADLPAPTCQPCTAACPEGEFLDGAVCGGRISPACVKCDDACTACNGPGSNQCTKCNAAAGLHLLGGRCVSDCGESLYEDSGACTACDGSCADCQGPGPADCTACPAGKVLMAGRCADACDSGFFEDDGARCRACTVCRTGTFAVGGCAGDANTVCKAWAAPCQEGVEYEAQAPSPEQDRVCTTCLASCPAGQQLTGECATADRVCEPCPTGSHKVDDGGHACSPCRTSCAEDQYMLGDCTATESPTCATCPTECAAGSYLAGRCDGSRAVPECKECSGCGPGQFTASACTSADGGRDTQCAACRADCDDQKVPSFLRGACGGLQDSECVPCPVASDCAGDQVLTGSCGAPTSRDTTACTDCHPDCVACDGPSSSDCTRCQRGLHLDGGNCVDNCGSGRFVTLDNQCRTCHPTCLQCSGAGDGDCVACNAGTFLLDNRCVRVCPSGMFADAASARCVGCSTCPPESFASGGCSGGKDTVCDTCDACEVGEFQVDACTSTQNRGCKACLASCPAGHQLDGNCGGARDAACVQCADGLFKSGPGGGPCTACPTACGAGQFLAGRCTATTTTTCRACRAQCPTGQFLQGVCGGSTDKTCGACDECGPAEYEAAPCTSNGNRRCAACRTACPTGQHLTGECRGTADASCQACVVAADCKVTEYLSGTCGGDADPRSSTECRPCSEPCKACSGPGTDQCTSCPKGLHLKDGQCTSECGGGLWEDGEEGVCSKCHPTCRNCRTGDADGCTACPTGKVLLGGTCVDACPAGDYADALGVCRTCRACADGSYAVGGCADSTDTECAAWDECGPGSYETTAPDAVTNRECSPCATECPPGERLVGQCTVTATPQCVPCDSGTFKGETGPQGCTECTADCAEGFFLTGTCSATRGPTCVPCQTVCPEGSFLEGVCSGRSSPTCQPCPRCHDDEYEVRPCTSSSKRVCETCTTARDCDTGEYLSGECDPTSDSPPLCRRCTTAAECGQGQFLDGKCAAESPNPTCRDCTPCQPWERQVSPCTATEDRVCAPCASECLPGSHLVGSCPGDVTDDFVHTVVLGGVTIAVLDDVAPGETGVGCQAAPLAVPEGWVLASPALARDAAESFAWGTGCIATADGEGSVAFQTSLARTDAGEPCPACGGADQPACLARDGPRVGVASCALRVVVARHPPRCEACVASCGQESFLAGTCAGRQSTSCQACRQCEVGAEYETVACAPNGPSRQDRQCAPCLTACDDGLYLDGECGATAGPSCKPCRSSCDPGYFLDGDCRGSSNPACLECTACVSGLEYQLSDCAEPGPTDDRACATCTTEDDCREGFYLSGECVGTETPVCLECPTAGDCGEGEYLAGTCAGRESTSCQACHPSCASCDGPGAHQCTSCPRDLLLVAAEEGGLLGTCESECPGGQAPAADGSGSCDTCDTSCSECETPGADGCTVCAGDLFLTEGQRCVAKCPGGRYGDSATGRCTLCSTCAAGSFASTACAAEADTVCARWTECEAGQQQQGDDPTATSDRACEACPSDTYQPQPGQRDCLPVRACDPADEFQTSAPSSTTNRDCAPLTVCTAGAEWEETPATATEDRRCAPLTVCTPEQYQSRGPTATSDRKCATITACDFPATEFQEAAATATNDTACAPLTACATDGSEYESQEPTLSSDRVCSAVTKCDSPATQWQESAATATADAVCRPLAVCGAGQYEKTAPTASSNRVCLDVAQCRQDQYEAEAPTATTDRVCKYYSTCASDEYEAVASTPTSDRECEKLTVCTPDVEYETAAATLYQDRECAACTSCGDTQFLAAVCTPEKDAECTSCTVCADHQYVAKACSPQGNSVCEDCDRCPTGSYTERACTATTNTDCAVCTSCADSEYLSRPCTSDRDSDCRAVSAPCQTGTQYEAAGPTATSDRDCRAVSPPCDAESEFQTAAATATSDRVCAPLTVCDFPKQYEAVAPTATANRVCDAVRTCLAGREWEEASPTPTSNRVCKPLTVCGAGFEVASQPTAQSDRSCRPCPAGTTDHDEAGSTACRTCPAGLYVPAQSTGACEAYACPPGTADLDGKAATACKACDGTGSFQDAAGQTACKRVTACKVGQEQEDAPAPDSDRTCRPCALGLTYNDVAGGSTCRTVTQCAEGEEEAEAPSVGSDRRCVACPQGWFKAEPGQATRCVAASVCPAGATEATAPTASSDRECAACPLGSFKDTSGQHGCSPHRDCADDEYEFSSPSATADRVCAKLTVCPPGGEHYEAQAPTATSDRVCAACTVCPTGHFARTACTATADTDCDGCPNCESGVTYVSQDCTATTTRVCTACKVCEAGKEWRETPCDISANTGCRALTECDAGTEYEKKAATATSDRECAALTRCDPLTEFIAQPHTTTADRVCQTLRVCPAGSQVSKANTLTSNRECELCPAGTTDDDKDGLTACVACGAGTFAPEGSQGACSALACRPGTADADKRADTACEACDAGNTYQEEAGRTACKPVTSCPAGETLLQEAKPAADRLCTPCPPRTFKGSEGQEECTPATDCSELTDKWQKSPANATADAECAPVTRCSDTQYESKAATTTSDRTCKDLTVCGEDQWASTLPTTTSDRGCTDLTVCLADEYQATAPTPAADRKCAKHTRCDCDREYEVSPATPLADRVCNAWTTCEAGEYQVAAPTCQKDRTCAPVQRCNVTAGEFQAVAATPTSDAVCESCRVCPGNTHYEVSPCSETANTRCAGCKVCEAGVTWERVGCSESADTQCAACDKCILGVSYADSPCTEDRNAECRPCSDCGRDQYIASVCNLERDTQCVNVTKACAEDEYQAGPPTRFSDRDCEPLTPCALGLEYESKEPSTFADRECSALTVCSADEYESTAPTATSDRKCKKAKKCKKDEFRSQPATSKRDASCQEIRQCTDAEYQSVAPTPVSDRECLALTVCRDRLEYETTAATTTSDRRCAPVPLPDTPPVPRIRPTKNAFNVGPSRADEDATTQLFSFATAGEGEMTASVGPVAATVAFVTEPRAATVVSLALLGDRDVFPEAPVVRAALHVLDGVSFSSVTAPTRVFARLRAGDSSDPEADTVDASCVTSGAEGVCVVAATVPTAWFADAASRTVTVQYGFQADADAGKIPDTLSQKLTLHAPAVVDPAGDVVFGLPRQQLFAGDSFAVSVRAQPEFALVDFTLSVSVSGPLRIRRVSLPSGDRWQGSSQVAGQEASITAHIASPQEAARSGRALTEERQRLCVVHVEVLDGAAEGLTGTVGVVVTDLDDIKGQRLRPGGRSLPSRAKAVDFEADGDGEATASRDGKVRFGTNRAVSLVAVLEDSVMINTAVLDAEQVSRGVRVYASTVSGSLVDVTSRAACSSSDTAVVKVAADCSRVFVDGTETKGAQEATVLVTLPDTPEVSQVSVSLQVWFPGALALTLEDPALSPIAGWADPRDGCRGQYQATAVTASAPFAAGSLATKSAADVTSLLAAALESSDEGVARVSGALVRGVSDGTAIIRAVGADGNVLASATVTVGGDAVTVARLDAHVVASVSVQLPGSGAVGQIPAVAGASATVRSALSDHTPAHVEASAVLSDGHRMEVVAGMGLQLLSLDPSVATVASAGQTVAAVGPGRGPLVSALWSSTCSDSSPSYSAKVAVDSTVAGPKAASVAVASRVSLAADSAAAAVGVAATAPLSVTLEMDDGTLRLLAPAAYTVSTVAGGVLAVATDGEANVVRGVKTGQDTVVVRVTGTAIEARATVAVVDVQGIAAAADTTTLLSVRADASAETVGYQHAMVSAVATLTDGSTAAVPLTAALFEVRETGKKRLDDALFEITTVGGRPACARKGAATGSSDLVVVWHGLTSRPTAMTAADGAVEVAAIVVTPPADAESTTLRGAAGETRQLGLAVVLSDGTTWTGGLAGLVTVASSDDAVVRPVAGGAVGLLELRKNSHEAVTLSASTAGAGAVSGSLDVTVNLVAAVGGVDLGNRDGPAAFPVSSAVQGGVATVAVRLNRANSDRTPDSIRLSYDPSVLHLEGVTSTSETEVFSVNDQLADAEGEVVITALASEPAAGEQDVATAIFSLKIRPTIAPGDEGLPATVITGRVVLADGSLGPADEAGALPLPVAREDSRRRRRRDADVACAAPPCEACVAPRDQGDANGDCVFDVQDVLFLQATLVGAGPSPSALLAFQRAALDANQDGAVTAADAYLLYRVLLRLARFAGPVTVTPVEAGESCRLDISAQVTMKGGAIAPKGTTTVLFGLQAAGLGSVATGFGFDLGASLAAETTSSPALDGLVLRATEADDGVFRASLVVASALPPNVALFAVVVAGPVGAGAGDGAGGAPGGAIDRPDLGAGTTTAATTTTTGPPTTTAVAGSDADARTSTLLGSPAAPFAFPALDLTVDVDGDAVSVLAAQGFNGLAVFNNTLTTAECHAACGCAAGEYEQTPSTATTHCVCAAVSPPCDTAANAEFEAAGPTATSDRDCQATRVCDCKVEFENEAPTLTSDRGCQALTPACDAAKGEVQTQDPTCFQDRQCSLDPCGSPNPCDNGGSCSGNEDGSFTCDCTGTGFTGDDCDVRDFCALPAPANKACANGATCESRDGGTFCVCSAGWQGKCCAEAVFFGDPIPHTALCADESDFGFASSQNTEAPSEKDAALTSNPAIVVGSILGGILFVVVLIALFALARRRRQQRTARNKAVMDDALAGMAMNELAVSSASNPLYSSLGDLAPQFRRCVSFDQARYRRKPLTLSNVELAHVYDIVGVARPPHSMLPALRYECLGMLQSPVTAGSQRKAVEQAVEFAGSAFADVLVEVFIDMIAAERSGAPAAACAGVYERYYATIDEDVAGVHTGQWGIYDDPRLLGGLPGEYSEVPDGSAAYLEPSPAAGKDEYLETDGPWSRAPTPGQRPGDEYARVVPKSRRGSPGTSRDRTYSLAVSGAAADSCSSTDPTYAVGNSADEPVYATGNNALAADEPVYAVGNSNSSTLDRDGIRFVAPGEETYEFASSLSRNNSWAEPPYVSASNVSGRPEAAYRVVEEEEEAGSDYELANHVDYEQALGSDHERARGDSFGVSDTLRSHPDIVFPGEDPTYDFGTAGTSESTDPLYDVGNDTLRARPGGGDASDYQRVGAESKGADGPEMSDYETAGGVTIMPIAATYSMASPEPLPAVTPEPSPGGEEPTYVNEPTLRREKYGVGEGARAQGVGDLGSPDATIKQHRLTMWEDYEPEPRVE